MTVACRASINKAAVFAPPSIITTFGTGIRAANHFFQRISELQLKLSCGDQANDQPAGWYQTRQIGA